MSKRGYLSRYLLILKKLKAKPYSTYAELKSYIENQFEYIRMMDEKLYTGFSIRTLQRDIAEIRNIFGIDIEYSTVEKGYFISHTESENMNFQRMMEAFDMFNSLNLAQDLTPFIHLEKRRPQGSENLYGLLHAIKNKVQIMFTYQKYWEDELTQRSAEPYALKEFKNRWYVLANDLKDNKVKSFALDRLSDLGITKNHFQFPNDFNINEHFKYCFGIISPNGLQPQEVILSFDPHQGKYIKSLPLHESQEILKDNEDELLIKLTLYITHDFFMELLSYGDNVEVIQPKALSEEIKAAHFNAFNQYQNE